MKIELCGKSIDGEKLATIEIGNKKGVVTYSDTKDNEGAVMTSKMSIYIDNAEEYIFYYFRHGVITPQMMWLYEDITNHNAKRFADTYNVRYDIVENAMETIDQLFPSYDGDKDYLLPF